jgi:hypothetical protein
VVEGVAFVVARATVFEVAEKIDTLIATARKALLARLVVVAARDAVAVFTHRAERALEVLDAAGADHVVLVTDQVFGAVVVVQTADLTFVRVGAVLALGTGVVGRNALYAGPVFTPFAVGIASAIVVVFAAVTVAIAIAVTITVAITVAIAIAIAIPVAIAVAVPIPGVRLSGRAAALGGSSAWVVPTTSR